MSYLDLMYSKPIKEGLKKKAAASAANGPAKKRGKPELEIQKDVIKRARTIGVHLYITNSSATFNYSLKRYMRNKDLPIGMSDSMGFDFKGRCLFVEFKASTKQSDEQKEFEQFVTANGAIYILCHSFDEFLDKYNKITGENHEWRIWRNNNWTTTRKTKIT